ncbi:MAG: hypothetical protein J5954_03100 [Prevotella sp.]|nr:hypothetical protein [Prevotella sp.]
MEQKRYPRQDEEENVGMACEPAVETLASSSASVNGITHVHDWIDDLDWERFPSFGPFSKEEAIARIEEAEKDLKDPSKWISSSQMWDRLYDKYPWLR